MMLNLSSAPLIGASASNKSRGIAWIDLSWPSSETELRLFFFNTVTYLWEMLKTGKISVLREQTGDN